MLAWFTLLPNVRLAILTQRDHHWLCWLVYLLYRVLDTEPCAQPGEHQDSKQDDYFGGNYSSLSIHVVCYPKTNPLC